MAASKLDIAIITRIFSLHGIGHTLRCMRYVAQANQCGNAQLWCHHGVVGVAWLTESLQKQVLCGLQQYIASLFKDPDDRKRYVAAAADCRVPYFDWAANPPPGESLLPSSIGNNPLVSLSGPNGLQVVSNPLFDYQFKPLKPDLFLNAEPVSMTIAAHATLLLTACVVVIMARYGQSSDKCHPYRPLEQFGHQLAP